MALPRMQFERSGWTLLSNIYILFLLFVAAELVHMIGFTAAVYESNRRSIESGHDIALGIDWAQTIGKPAIFVFYACVCFLLRETVLLVAKRSGIWSSDDVGTGSNSSAVMMAVSKYLAYCFIVLGVFALGQQVVSGLEIGGRTVLGALYYGLRAAVEQWFYAAVLIALPLILIRASSEEQS